MKKLRKYNIILAIGIVLLVACFAVGAVCISKTFIKVQKNIIGIIGIETNAGEYLYSIFEPLNEEYIIKGDNILDRFGVAENTLLRNDVGRTLFVFFLLIAIVISAITLVMCVTLQKIKIEYSKSVMAFEKEIYELKKKEQYCNYLEERNSWMQCFIENVAHQVKTPISRVSTSLEIVKDNVQNEQAEQRLEECFEHLDSVRLLMKKLTDIGCLEAGKVVFQKERINLKEIAVDALFAVGCDENNSTINIPEDVELFGDYEWLKEALVNICGNSIEHDNSGIPIELSCTVSKDNIHLIIRDHGTGICEKDADFLFDRFYIPQNMKKGHTGIGLNLAKLIIDNHNGNIHIYNHEKQGTIVKIVIPIYCLKQGKI